MKWFLFNALTKRGTVKKSDLVLSVMAVLIVSGLFAKGVQLLITGEVATCLRTVKK